MQEARYRALACNPPGTLKELAPYRGTVALRCSQAGCARCATFESERDAFEGSLQVDSIVPWDCSGPKRRKLAVDAGVAALPAYIILSNAAPPRIRTPGRH